LALMALTPVAEARADWLFTPFIGSGFGTDTTFVLLEAGATKGGKLMFGGSAALLSRGIFGVEADYAYASRFFERSSRSGEFSGSNLNTLSGSVIAAMPLSVTRESLRPYAIGGLGLMHAAATNPIDFLTFDENFAGVNVGGGVIGLISAKTGLRFEIRHFHSLGSATNALTGENGSRLSFWRVTAGVVIRLEN
jgi:opacity protein-like surface antigen